MAALQALSGRHGGEPVLTVRETYAEMRAQGTRYAEPTLFKTMQRMKQDPVRPPYIRLERVGQQGFRLESQV